jgi:Icc-related predicted phosphoesterase
MKHSQVVLPEGDVLIHSGDALNWGSKEELFLFSKWWQRLEFKNKIFVPGNHDWVFQKDPEWAREMLVGTKVLIHEAVEIEGVKFFGTPWQPVFCDWAFNLEDGFRTVKFEQIPKVDVLISHAPPFGVCDLMFNSVRVGDKELEKAVRIQDGVLLCGHIHSGYGHGDIGPLDVYNSALCDEKYKLVNKPQVIEL